MDRVIVAVVLILTAALGFVSWELQRERAARQMAELRLAEKAQVEERKPLEATLKGKTESMEKLWRRHEEAHRELDGILRDLSSR